MDPAIAPNPVASLGPLPSPSSASAGPTSSPSPRSASRWLWWVLVLLIAVFGALAAFIAWQLQSESLRQRVEAGLEVALERPVQLGALQWSWRAAPVGSDGDSLLVVVLRGLNVPAQAARRGFESREVVLFLGTSPRAWWNAWRYHRPWPVTGLQAQGLQSRPVDGAADDGYGDWALARLDVTGLVADRVAPRALRVRTQGTWRRLQGQAAWPVVGELHDLAVAGSGLSLERALLAVGSVQWRLDQAVVSPESTTFALEVLPLNLRAALPPLGIALPATTDAMAFSSFSLRADCHLDALGAGCDSLVLRVDDTTLRGLAARVAAPTGAQWRMQLQADRLALDRYLPPDNPRDPPFQVPWELANAWPVAGTLKVDELQMAGLRVKGAALEIHFGAHGLVVQ
jgi:hypothetical protein